MNRCLMLLIGGAALALQCLGAADSKEWKYYQSVPVNGTGMVRVRLSAETLAASRLKLEDLRVLSPLGVEQPFAIERPEFEPPRVESAKSFQVRLEDQKTVMEMETGTAHPLTGLVLESPAPSFIKSINVEGSNDGQQWVTLVSSAMIFRQPSGAANLQVPLNATRWSRLQVTVDDQRNAPVPFTSAKLELEAPQPPLVTQRLTSVGGSMGQEETRLNFHVSHLQVASVKLLVTEPLFSRPVRVSYFDPAENPGNPEVIMGRSVIYRVRPDNREVASLEIPIHALIQEGPLVVTLENGSNPPLHVKEMEITWMPVDIVFLAHMTGEWRLATGHPTIAAPHYDLSALQQQLGKVPVSSATPGPLQTAADYRPPTPLPGVTPAGAALDLAPWHYRKPLADVKPGVVRMDLDAETLAHSDYQSDLRLIQDGKQVPFLLENNAGNRSMDTELSPAPDPKRPSVSIWRATLPLERLPALHLVLHSSTPLFERHVTVTTTGTNSEGGSFRLSVSNGAWVRKTNAAPTDFSLPLNSVRLRKEFFIEIEDGDNAPIALEKVRVEYPSVSVIAKVAHSAPLFLYYGNEDASMPRYDLALARTELLASPMTTAGLGAEETLHAEKRAPAAGLGSGSPWLWAALALVLVVLLWVVAKMLPRNEAPTE